jgi:hypothetical protein
VLRVQSDPFARPVFGVQSLQNVTRGLTLRKAAGINEALPHPPVCHSLGARSHH